MSSSSFRLSSVVLLSLLICSLMAVSEANFYDDVEIDWGEGHGNILDGGQLLTLSMDKTSGAGFITKKEYLFGRFDVQIKLVPGYSAGTVTTFYLSSLGPTHDVVDFEFLGNTSGDPYTLHTNVYVQGQGRREQGFSLLWFDPTKDFHTYSIDWNPERITFLVDYKPIRVFNNLEKFGVPFPNKQPMRLYGSLWDADDWATKGGTVKADWSKAPFVASYRNFNVTAYAGQNLQLNAADRNNIRWVQKKFMIYNYCYGNKIVECSTSQFRLATEPRRGRKPGTSFRGSAPNNNTAANFPRKRIH